MKTSLYTEHQLQAIRRWQNLQFGMFIHFGLYSLAGGCWKGLPVKRGYCEQILSHGELPQADYEALLHEFLIPDFNAESIVRLAKVAGMRYIVVTAKHHDGFCLFNTKTTSYNSMNAACKRDIAAELSAACKKEGLAFGVYFSLIDWHCPDALPISAHNSDRIPPKHHEYNCTQLTELLTNYGEICELWLDMGYPTAEQSQDMYELVHSLQNHIMINGRIWNDMGDFATLPDNATPELPVHEYELNVPWQTPASIYKETWGYKSRQERGNIDEKIAELTGSLRRVVSGGGNYLLNIGPDNTGKVISFEKEVLEGIGRSLREKPLPSARSFGRDESQTAPFQVPPIQAEKDGSFRLTACTNLFRYTGSEYYTLRPIITGKRWRVAAPPESAQTVFMLGWKCVSPLKEDIKLCFEDDDTRLYFSLRKGKTYGLIGSCYRLPQNRRICTLELSTVGSPHSRGELIPDSMMLTLEKAE